MTPPNEDIAAAIARVARGDDLGSWRQLLLDCASEIDRLRAEVAAMQGVVEAAAHLRYRQDLPEDHPLSSAIDKLAEARRT